MIFTSAWKRLKQKKTVLLAQHNLIDLHSHKAGLRTHKTMHRNIKQKVTEFVQFTAVMFRYHFFRFRYDIDNVGYSSWAHRRARSGLHIRVNWTFFVRCYGWGATSEYWLEIGVFEGDWPVSVNFSHSRGRPPRTIFCIGQWMPYNFVADSIHTKNFVEDFLQVKCNFRRKTAVLRFRAPILRA